MQHTDSTHLNYYEIGSNFYSVALFRHPFHNGAACRGTHINIDLPTYPSAQYRFISVREVTRVPFRFRSQPEHHPLQLDHQRLDNTVVICMAYEKHANTKKLTDSPLNNSAVSDGVAHGRDFHCLVLICEVVTAEVGARGADGSLSTC